MLWNFQQRAFPALANEGDNSSNGEKERKDCAETPRNEPGKTLQDLPRPIARKLKLIIDGVMGEFVVSWYTQICPEDQQFVDETRRALEEIAVEGYKRICNVDTHSAAVNVINLLTGHLKIFNDCCDAVNSKYPGINSVDFERCVTELYEIKINHHISSRSQGTALDYFRKITDVLMYVLMPQSAFSCEGGRFMLREILAIQGLQNLVDLLSDPHFVNKALIDIFEEAVPKEIILQQWKQEASKELISDDETDSEDKVEDKPATAFGSRLDSDTYESASEMGGKPMINHKSKVHSRIKNSSYSSMEQVNTVSDALESKFATPRHSTTEWSSADESYNAFDRVLRQNQLEARSSAPVYGSTMVKLHEKSEQPQMPNVHFQVPVRNHAANAFVSRADSGVYSETVRLRSCSAPLTQVNELAEKKNEHNVKKVKPKSKHHKHKKRQACKSNFLNDMQSQVISLPDDNIPEAWSCCPPPESNYYRKISYNEMDRRQDLFSEQLKAKLHVIGDNVKHISCMKSIAENEKKHRSLPDLTNSFESSMVICPPKGSDIYFENGRSKKEVGGNVENRSKKEYVKIHSIPERNAFYEIAPDCPTCIEMTSLASPKQNSKAILTFEPKQIRAADHECGLSVSHFFHPEVEENFILKEDDDNESFISFDSADSLSDHEDTQSTIASESTLLASVESTGIEESHNLLRIKSKKKHFDSDLKSSSVGSFDVVSLKESDSEFSSATDFGEDISNQNSFDSNGYLDRVSFQKASKDKGRAPSITTFTSAFDSSTHEYGAHQQHLKTPMTNKTMHHSFSSIIKHIKSPISSKLKRGKVPKISSKVAKSLKKLRTKMHVTRKSESSDEDSAGSIPIPEKRAQKKKRVIAKRFDLSLGKEVTHGELKEEDLENSYSGTTDSSQIYSLTYPKASSNGFPVDHMISQWQQEAFMVHGNVVEEVADEILEEVDCSESFHDAKSLFEAASDISDQSTVNSLLMERKSNFGEGLSLVHIDNDDKVDGNDEDDDVDHTDYGHQLDMRGNLKGNWILPIYDGEVILPHPGKMHVSAWMYPIQMISIPSTEVAFEKGWEPGGNKYTLYSINYDIRIWPEIYQHQMMEASQKPALEGNPPDGIPIIREIKRRYREFMYLHNRLTHSQMSDCMKGVLRPNRRYGMPFGRMDPDVIEGRRKILETYLVSLVSRPEVCNSREFKEFLGAEGYGSVSVVKQKVMQPKQMVNKVIGSIKSAFPASKDVTEKGESFQYFIHGYDVPRMFGYAKDFALDRNSSPWFSSFVEMQEKREMIPEGETSLNSRELNFTGKIEFHQRPKPTGADSQDSKNEKMSDRLGLRLAGDGSEFPDVPADDYFTESPERRFSVGIPALFTNELAARSKNETLSTIDARKADEDIPWPLSDAVMSFLCQGLKGYNCWLTYENVQQALLYSLGGLLEWKISREIDEVLIEERWMKYLNDLYHVIWKDGKLIEPQPEPTAEEKKNAKEEALEKMLDFLPSIVRIIIGSNEYRQWGEGLLHAVQYKKINRHLLFAVIDLIMCEFIPELQHGFPEYKSASRSST